MLYRQRLPVQPVPFYGRFFGLRERLAWLGITPVSGVGFAKKASELPTLPNPNFGLANSNLAVAPSNRCSRQNLSRTNLPHPCG